MSTDPAAPAPPEDPHTAFQNALDALNTAADNLAASVAPSTKDAEQQAIDQAAEALAPFVDPASPAAPAPGPFQDPGAIVVPPDGSGLWDGTERRSGTDRRQTAGASPTGVEQRIAERRVS